MIQLTELPCRYGISLLGDILKQKFKVCWIPRAVAVACHCIDREYEMCACLLGKLIDNVELGVVQRHLLSAITGALYTKRRSNVSCLVSICAPKAKDIRSDVAQGTIQSKQSKASTSSTFLSLIK